MKFDNAYINNGTLFLEKSTGEGSGYVIELSNDFTLSLFSIPLYGGQQRFEGEFDTIAEAVEVAESWT